MHFIFPPAEPMVSALAFLCRSKIFFAEAIFVSMSSAWQMHFTYAHALT